MLLTIRIGMLLISPANAYSQLKPPENGTRDDWSFGVSLWLKSLCATADILLCCRSCRLASTHTWKRLFFNGSLEPEADCCCITELDRDRDTRCSCTVCFWTIIYVLHAFVSLTGVSCTVLFFYFYFYFFYVYCDLCSVYRLCLCRWIVWLRRFCFWLWLCHAFNTFGLALGGAEGCYVLVCIS